MKNTDVIIIGSGAAGLIAACRASELGHKVLVIEKMSVPGKKLLITGKGRCNITNNAEVKEFISQVNPDGRILFSVFKQFYSYEILDLLQKEMVEVKLERGGRYFPVSDNASDVVNALYNRAKRQNVSFYFDAEVKELLYNEDSICGVKFMQNNNIKQAFANKVIVCTGGKSYPKTGSTGDGYKFAKTAGHNINKTFPALVPLISEGNLHEKMQGLSLKNVEISLLINDKIVEKQFGEMIFTHYGLSGPVIITISRKIVLALYNKNKVEIELDWKPALSNERLNERLLRDINNNGKLKVLNIFKKWLPQKAIPVFIEHANIDPHKLANQISSKERTKIVELMKKMQFIIQGHRGYKEAIITAGGIPLDEINPKTMESKIKKGLYFAGEVLDLDANTGGYNLQIAFSTGWIAGQLVSCMNSEGFEKR